MKPTGPIIPCIHWDIDTFTADLKQNPVRREESIPNTYRTPTGSTAGLPLAAGPTTERFA
jgi:hypothetical protein